ncbi:MAG: SRPBCC family protein [Vulcanimicrobiaceae bacterium]
MAEIRTVAIIRRRPEDVFAYATVPANWPRWHPSSLKVTGITERTLQVGESCHEEFVTAGKHGTCEWTARECVPGRRWVIETRTQREKSVVIAYNLDPLGDFTRYERFLSYRMASPFLVLLDLLVLRRRVRKESDEATLRLKAALEEHS